MTKFPFERMPFDPDTPPEPEDAEFKVIRRPDETSILHYMQGYGPEEIEFGVFGPNHEERFNQGKGWDG